MKKLLIYLISFFIFGCNFSSLVIAKELSTEVTTLINQYRLQQGLPKLTTKQIISNIAKVHSQNMAADEIPFGHAQAPSRVSYLKKYYKMTGFAENVAVVNDNNPQKIVSLWINSSNHRKNIEGDYNLTGVGVVRAKNSKIYVTQIFIRATINS